MRSGAVAQEAGDWRLEAGSWRRGAVAALTRLETGGWRRDAVAQEAGGWRLEGGDWMLDAGGVAMLRRRLLAVGCFDEAGGVASFCRLLETVAPLRRKNGWRCGR